MAVGLIVLGIFCIVYYLCSVVYAGVGVSMIWIWLAGGLLLTGAGAAMLYGRKQGMYHGLPFWAKCVLGICIAGGILFVLVMEGMIFSGMSQKGKPDLDYIIVLGCQVKGERPSRALKERLETAKEYLEENPETRAVLSGGKGNGEMISEAECMYRWLTEEGVDSDRLLMEDQSTTTKENLLFSRKLLEEESVSVGLVTNNFHVYRSVRLAKKAGYTDCCGIAAPSRTLLQLHYLVRECFALTKEFLAKNI